MEPSSGVVIFINPGCEFSRSLDVAPIAMTNTLYKTLMKKETQHCTHLLRSNDPFRGIFKSSMSIGEAKNSLTRMNDTNVICIFMTWMYLANRLLG